MTKIYLGSSNVQNNYMM